MSYLQVAIAVLFTPVSAVLIALWVLRDGKKITAKAHARAAQERGDAINRASGRATVSET
ncbi:hypothetical protein SAMN06297251_104167 [Fulvimarina manganoxydans]|uniref:Uncharacterized protein n=1 Tax=Fulvimarina manganoxydans TaxID=937218 RepID=A0A1W2AH93_9HYPH|nr:hypothetical protein SAMN06297251_104167 [Fulvimarina manganoxydans]